MKKMILIIIIICFYNKLYCQSDFYKQIIKTNIQYYWTTCLNQHEQKTYEPILSSLDYCLQQLFNEINNDSIYSQSQDFFFLSGTNSLGYIVWSELWFNDTTQFNYIYTNENKSRQVTKEFPEPLIYFKNDIENWSDDFIHTSTYKTYVCDASVFIAFSGKIDNNSNYTIQVKAFVEY